MSEKRYGAWEGKHVNVKLDGWSLADLAADDSVPVCAELARDLLASQERIVELEATLATREQQLSELRKERQEGKYSYRRRVEELEATLARVRELPATWRPAQRTIEQTGWTDGRMARSNCADALEAALTGDGECMLPTTVVVPGLRRAGAGVGALHENGREPATAKA